MFYVIINTLQQKVIDISQFVKNEQQTTSTLKKLIQHSPSSILLNTLSLSLTLSWCYNISEICLNQTKNKPESCINGTLHVPEYRKSVNLTCINRTPVYSKLKGWFQRGSVWIDFTV